MSNVAPITTVGPPGVVTTGAVGGVESSSMVGTSVGDDSRLATSAVARKSFSASCARAVLMLKAVAPPVSCRLATCASAPLMNPSLFRSV